ncbi:esterase-like activity of phytase family protein [Rhodobacter sp. CZR27]|uniref:esterase-like activity of phytase family protein n=1 Tax=Rhodobacter sp. CZR27 TaxID=2033869 RepID=UPI000BBE40C8|nr:esterase-like activity of phytase family protein [Rhodobacter sp. CZR27]
MPRSPRLALTAGLMLGLALCSSASAPPVGGTDCFVWREDDVLFGGLSAIEMSADGREITVLSDRGAWTRGHVQRDAAGRITGIEVPPLRPLLARGTAPLARARSDSEGLAIAPDGTAYVSFEGAARVLRYRDLTGSAVNLRVHRDFALMQGNAALEALAIDRDGNLYTLPERSGSATRPFPVYRFREGRWDQPFAIPRRGAYLAVGADFGPDGRLYLLERRFRGLLGFGSRVRRFELGPAGILSEETVFESPSGVYDNLEGLAVWQEAGGGIVISMVSDDNFLFVQRTEIVEHRLAH